jgi:hypothetical protein
VYGASRSVEPVDLFDLPPEPRLSELAYGHASDNNGVEAQRSVPSIVTTVDSIPVLRTLQAASCLHARHTAPDLLAASRYGFNVQQV